MVLDAEVDVPDLAILTLAHPFSPAPSKTVNDLLAVVLNGNMLATRNSLVPGQAGASPGGHRVDLLPHARGQVIPPVRGAHHDRGSL